MSEEEKVYTSMYSRNAELYHHGIKGQKWGVSNGPPYPLSDEVSTGKSLRQKQIEKLKKESDRNRNIIKRNENFYKEKENRNIKMRENDRDKKIEKANKKFERQEKSIKKHINSQKNSDISTKAAKEDAIKAEIKMKKLLAKENGGKYRYKDMTDEEKEYYRKEFSRTIHDVAWLTLVAGTAAVGAYEFHEAKRGDDHSDYGINRRPDRKTRKEIAKGQLERAKEANIEAKYGSLRKDYAKYSQNSTRIAKVLKENRDTNIEQIDRKIEWAKQDKKQTNPKLRDKSNSELDKEIKELEKDRERIKQYYDKKIKEAETSAMESYNWARGR